jgi:hypothetical protein
VKMLQPRVGSAAVGSGVITALTGAARVNVAALVEVADSMALRRSVTPSKSLKYFSRASVRGVRKANRRR